MLKKKSLGQNFLKLESALLAMVSAGKVSNTDFVLEIGPGEGALTEKLLETGCRVLAIEKDQRLIPILGKNFSKDIETRRLQILEGDILETDTQKHLPKKYKVIANIPYYITGQIIRMFLETERQPETLTLLVQKEVADRIMARDGKENLLSLSVKIFGEPQYVKTVRAGSFVPAPKVDSAIISINNISNKNINGFSKETFFEIIHLGFAHKRKQLLPNLASIFNKEKLIQVFEANKINQKARAEDLSLEQWTKLVKTINDFKNIRDTI